VTQQFLADRLTCEPDVQVAGRASDGEEALRLALQLRPDLICLDLEMPRMNGFTVLRVLMSKQPAPVIVVSSNARKEDVFKALELGALDFVAKPEAGGDLSVLARELSSKLAMVRALRAPTTRRGASPAPEEPAPPPQRPARLARIRISEATSPSTLHGQHGTRFTWNLPASIFERSRMLLMIRRRCLPLSHMSLRYAC